jgi:hypothetical protein
MRTTLCLLTLIALAPALASGSEEGWRKEKDESGIQMYTRAVEGWEIREIRGVTRVEAPLTAVAAVLDDIPAAVELNSMVNESRVIERQGPRRLRTYAAMDMPWPVSDRDLVNDRTIEVDSRTRAITFTDVATEDGVAPRADFVRMVKSRQTWTLTPAADGAVEVELRVLADPNGPIPTSLINSMSIDSPFATLGRLQALARSPKYANATPSFLAGADKGALKKGEAR